jgi:carbohydrate-binding DOMON domain-containing protein
METIVEIDDPEGDDHGPGGYTYPTDAAFTEGAYDLTGFRVGQNERNVIFQFRFDGEIGNPWDSPIGLSVQTLDVYIDADPGKGTGARMLLEGRNAALEPGYGWDAALWVEGWNQKVLVPGKSGPSAKSGNPVNVVVDAGAGTITLLVPKAALPEGDPGQWAYTAAVLSQEGFPSPGVRRVRDVASEKGQWTIGGGSGSVNDTRILDVAWPAETTPGQETMLSDYPKVDAESVDELSVDQFAQLRMIEPGSSDER